jgi:hypothetical protein
MSDELFAMSSTFGLLVALLLWVPAIDRIQRFVRSAFGHQRKS